MKIRHNISAMNVRRNQSNNNKKVSSSLEKLSSGHAINRASDDAAGLAISEKMKMQIGGVEEAVENVKQGIGLVQVMDGALQEYHNILQRMNELAHQSSNGTLDDIVDRPALQKEFEALREELDSIARSTQYNEIPCFVGTPSDPPIPQTPTLDIVFILDRTGSMNGPITNVKNNLNDFVSQMAGTDVRIGIAHYTDGQTPPIQIEAFADGTQFSSDTAEISQLLTSLAANTPGGTEDGIDAINQALQMDFRPNAGKHFIILGDEPITTGGADPASSVVTTALQNTAAALKNANVTLTVIGDGDVKSQLCGDGKMTGDSNFIDISSNFSSELKKLGSDIVDSLPSDNPNDWFKLDDLILQIGNNVGETLAVERRPVIPEYFDLDDAAIDPLEKAREALEKVMAAINGVSEYRGTLGSNMNRLEHTLKVLSYTTENLTDALSVIRDTDMAEEMTELTKHNILSQASQSMLAQANQAPQGVLQLLK